MAKGNQGRYKTCQNMRGQQRNHSVARKPSLHSFAPINGSANYYAKPDLIFILYLCPSSTDKKKAPTFYPSENAGEVTRWNPAFYRIFRCSPSGKSKVFLMFSTRCRIWVFVLLSGRLLLRWTPENAFFWRSPRLPGFSCREIHHVHHS